MAKKAGISSSSVGRIWRAHGLKPHIVRGFKLSNDPQFIEKVRDIVGLYMNPLERAVVFSFDDKPQIQALERAQPILPMDLGIPERQTHNYIRHGTLDLFAALNIATGEVIAKTKKQHRAKDFVSFLRELDKAVVDDLEVHVILDNLSAHKADAVKRWLVRRPRFGLHFTPTYSSWLNLVERFFALRTDEAHAAAVTPASLSSATPSSSTSRCTMTRASRSRGRRPLTRSSTRSASSASGR